MTRPPQKSSTSPKPRTSAAEIRFVNGLRLSGRHWFLVLILTLLVLTGTPWIFQKIERFDTGPDYRIPYELSKDYWLYQRWLQRSSPTNIIVLGDSVVWGEYVRPTGTLSHFLNEQSGQAGRFVNAGVNGLFPLALEGLGRDYARTLRHRQVILHCNVLWMSSPKADLHTDKEQRFNHAGLVPQFMPRIPCYRSDLNQRLAAVVERHFTFSQWAHHLQVAYFDQKNILAWTLEEDSSDPSLHPNTYKNPFAQITLRVPPEPEDDPERGPTSPRHRPWSTTGEGSTRFAWVELDGSLQWAAFQRLVKLLQARGNDLLVVVGPFNEHLMAPENRPGFYQLRDGITEWLAQQEVKHVVPDALPSLLYADASHPLTEGYAELARRLYTDPGFRQWLKSP